MSYPFLDGLLKESLALDLNDEDTRIDFQKRLAQCLGCYVTVTSSHTRMGYLIGFIVGSTPYRFMVGGEPMYADRVETLLRETYIRETLRRKAGVEFFINAVDSLSALTYDTVTLKSLETQLTDEVLTSLQTVLDAVEVPVKSFGELPSV